MQRGAMRLLEIPLARHTLELPPWFATRMPVGADVAPAPPAVVGAIISRAELGPCIDRASASSCVQEQGGGAQRACGGDAAACSQAAHSGLGRRPAKGGRSLERFLMDLTGGSVVRLVPSPTQRRSTQSHNSPRSWRGCKSQAGPISAPSYKDGREISPLVSGPTIIRSLEVHDPKLPHAD